MTEPGRVAKRPSENGETKPRLLIVPHVYAGDIRVREIEFARRLTGLFDVYCLKWNDALHVDGTAGFERRWRQFRAALGSCVVARRHDQADGMMYVQTPVLQPIMLRRLVGRDRALALAQRFNQRALDEVIKACGASHLLLASEQFGVSANRGVRTFFDIVDWFPEENLQFEDVERLRVRLRNYTRHFDGIFVASEPLRDKLAAEFGIRAVAIPNGADIQALRSVDAGRADSLRRELGLEGKFVIGYIGNHGPFTGVDFLLKVFEAVRHRIPEAALLIAGPAECWRALLHAKRSEGVVATGPVRPSEVGSYFHVIDIGVLAQEKSLGTEFAFQIKMVEYTACKKFVVSTPLETWRRLQWPNIFLAELEVDTWLKAICRAREARWSLAWDALVEAYDWNTLAVRMAAVMLAGRAEPVSVK